MIAERSYRAPLKTRAEPHQPTPQVAPRRRRRPRSHRLKAAVGGVAVGGLIFAYVFGHSAAARHSYERSRSLAHLRKLQAEQRLLEAQVADGERLDRVLFLAGQQGMVPRQALQYVALKPEPGARSFRQASARR